MRTKAFLMAAGVLAVSGGIAQAQAQAPAGRYGGGLIEALMSGGAAPARPATVYGARGQELPQGPVASYRRDPRAVPVRNAALSQPRYGNPYEDADPFTPMPEPAVAAPATVYRNAAPVARAPDPQFTRQVVPFAGRQGAGTIVVDTQARHLYLVQADRSAIRYGIGVGRPGFLWHGVKAITAKKEWPDWTPPKEMLARRPDLPTFMAGGVENPLGARALYLGSSLYRIHGTNEPNTIGQAVSSGCIRMMNEDVIDLYQRTPVGARVEVI